MRYATVEDLEARWRELSEDEAERAETVLSDVSLYIDALSCRRPEEMDGVWLERAKVVCCSVARRQMQTASDMSLMGTPPSTQVSMTAGSYQQTFSPVNPAGDIYLTKTERKLLGIGSQKMGTISPVIGWGC